MFRNRSCSFWNNNVFINVKDKMFIGPVNGEFYPVTIRSIHNSVREDVDTIGNLLGVLQLNLQI